MTTRLALSVALLLVWSVAARADKLVLVDASEIALTLGPDGRAVYKQDYHQDLATSEQQAFAVEGKVTWRDKPWQDLSLNGSRVIYKVRLDKPVAKLQLGFAFWATKDTEGFVWASSDGQKWAQVWAYDPKNPPDTRLSGVADVTAYQSRDAQPVVFLKLGTNTQWGLLFGWSLTAYEKQPPAVAAYKPGPVPPDGALRYCIQYGDVSPDLLYFLQNARVNFLHWHGPFSGYNGFVERSKLESTERSAKATIDQVHAAGMSCILYIGPCFSYGDKVKRDRLFNFYDKIWPQYEDYFGKKPGDLLEMAQCDAQGRPRPYVYEGDEGYHLCVNSPGVRQYTKGLMRMIIESGGDGSFYDGPYVTEGCCYCKWCTAKFRQWLKDTYSPADLDKHFGVTDLATVEPPRSAKEKLWVPFRRFNVWSLYDFMCDTKQYARSLNPNYIMTSNYCMWDGEPFSPIRGTAEDAEVESRVIDVLFDEAKYGDGPHWEKGKVSNSTDCRHLYAAAHGIPSALLKTAPEGTSPQAGANLARLALAESAANGITWQFCQLKPNAIAGAEQYSAFLASRQDALTACHPWSTVGVWTSSTQAYFDAATYPTAVSRFLADSHIPHQFVTDEQVAHGKLDQYEVLIVPEVHVISTAQLAALQAFLAQGKGLVLMGPCGAQDEWGDKRANLPFGQPSAVTETSRRSVGKGRVVCLPSVPLLQSPNNGLPPGDVAKLSALPDLLDWASDRGLPACVQGTEQVEVTVGCDGKSKLLVHLVNYGVDLNGNLSPVTDLAVMVRLPNGMAAKSPAELYTPEAPAQALALETSRPGPEQYVSFTLPQLGVYSQVEIPLVPSTKPLAARLPRLLTTVQGEAAPGGTVTLEASLQPGATWQLTHPADWQVREVPTPSGRSFALSLPAGQAAGVVPCRLTATTAQKVALSRVVWVEVKAPFAISLRLPVFANTVSGRSKAEVTIHNRLPQALDAKLKLTLPPGWTAEAGEGAVKVPAQGDQQVVLWLTSPPQVAAGAYEVKAEVTAGNSNSSASATLAVVASLRMLNCPLVGAAPKLDGVLDDACWQKAAVVGDFQRTDGQGLAKQPTNVRVCYDAKALYVGFECQESEPQTIIKQIEEDGGEVWRDDSVEVFVDSTLTRQNLWHWTANAAGRKNPAQWWTCAATQTATGWTVEMVLPITDKVQPGDMMGLNFCRTRPSRPQSAPEYSSWSGTQGSFWHPEDFGVIVFGGR